MSPKKQEVRLMFFSGFYESIHDSVFDMETEYIMEDYPDKEWDAVELGTLLDAWIIDNNGELDDIDYVGFEYCSGNGQYVDYKLVENETTQHK